MYSNQENFKKAVKWTDILMSRYLNTLASFRIYERFREVAAPNKAGKRKADANVKVLSQHCYFFLPLQEAARYYFFIELAKFFDVNKREQSLTIETILDLIEKNIVSFSKDEFRRYHSGRTFIPELLAEYVEFSLYDIKKIRNRLKGNKKTISDLKNYRDQFLAHDDIKKTDIKINGSQIKTLLKIIQDVIDLLYLRLDFSSNIYSNYSEEPASAVDNVIKALQEHEKERILKIKKEYKIK